MAGSKKKKLKKQRIPQEDEDALDIGDAKNIPIPNLPSNFLWMKVKSSSKIRNLLPYALKEFSKHNSIVWSATGSGVSKAISCAEFFKRKIQGLHQLTRIKYVQNENSEDMVSNKIQRIPEIYIFFTTTPSHINELGYQGPEDDGTFITTDNNDDLSTNSILNFNKQITNSVVNEFAAMGLRTGQKRTARKDDNIDGPSKKNKKNIQEN